MENESVSALVSAEEPQKKTPRMVNKKVIAEGKWLGLNEITYEDKQGTSRRWEMMCRTTRTGCGVDAVTILPILKRTLKYDCLICIKQYRPPMDAFTLEFPAGLVDSGETVEVAAQRELREETGYTAIIKHTSPPTCLDPGTENCTMVIVTAEIDGDDPINVRPTQQQEETESIEVVIIPVDDLLGRLNEFADDGVVVDARVYSYAIASCQARKQHRKELGQK